MKYSTHITHITHSTTDWDFLDSSDWSPWANWGLHAYMAVSPPTCLWFNPGAAGVVKYFLSNLPQAQDLKEGRLITWHCQQAFGLGWHAAFIGVTGPGSTGIVITLPRLSLIMKRYRIDWWQSYNAACNPITRVKRYAWIADEWVFDFETEETPMAGAVNRVGYGASPQSLSAQKYFDDTEIWALK